MSQSKKTTEYTGEIPNTPLGFIWYVSKPFRWWLFALMVVITAGAILSQSSSYFFKLIVDSAEAGEGDKVVLFALLYPCVIFTAQTLFRVSGWLGKEFVPSTVKNSADILQKYTLSHSHTYFANRFAGSILAKFSNVSGGINQIFPEFFWTIYTGLLSFLVTFLILLTVDTYVAWIFLSLVVILIVFNRKLAPRKRELSRLNADARSALSGRGADVLSNISAARQYARVSEELNELKELTERRRYTSGKTWMYSEKVRFLNGTILFVALLIIFMIVINQWQLGTVSTGELVLVLALISQISYSLLFIGQAFNSVAESFGEMEEGLEDVFIDHEISDSPNATKLKVNAGEIAFNNVNFAYEADDTQTVFNDLALTIEPGQRVGLVGPSGAGKSTLVSLLLRQHDVDGGTITIDGQSIAEVTQDSLRSNIAVVPQEPLLFHRSIAENIKYGKPEAADEEIVAVAKKAQAHDFIEILPEGYDTLVGERGVKLSGGQKQRVAIARAMLKDAPILVLDEATSALDSESEVAIQTALQKLMEGKTVIAVAHRLSTLRRMDRILVIDNGSIIQDGTHDELADQPGLYKKLWEHQAGGFLKD